MSYSNTFVLALCAMFALTGCQDRRADMFVHEGTGCQSDADCLEAFDGTNTSYWCDASADNGTCYYQTFVDVPSCFDDLDCDDGDLSSTDACSYGACHHRFETPIEANEGVVTHFIGYSSLIVATDDAWQRLGDLEIEGFGVEPQTITEIMFLAGNADGFSEYAIALNGQTIATTTPVGVASYFKFSDLGLVIDPAVGQQIYEIWGRVNETHYLSVPGRVTALALAYAALANEAASSIAFDEGQTRIDFTWSKPSLTEQRLASTYLANTTQDLYKVQIVADSHGPVRIESFGLHLSPLADSQATVSNLRLFVGAGELSPDLYTVHLATNNANITGQTIATNGSPVNIYFRFTEGLIVENAVFTVVGTTQGFVAGDRLFVTHGERTGTQDACTSVTGYPLSRRSALIWSDIRYTERCFGATQIEIVGEGYNLTR